MSYSISPLSSPLLSPVVKERRSSGSRYSDSGDETVDYKEDNTADHSMISQSSFHPHTLANYGEIESEFVEGEQVSELHSS